MLELVMIFTIGSTTCNKKKNCAHSRIRTWVPQREGKMRKPSWPCQPHAYICNYSHTIYDNMMFYSRFWPMKMWWPRKWHISSSKQSKSIIGLRLHMGHVHGSVTPISIKYNRRNLNSVWFIVTLLIVCD